MAQKIENEKIVGILSYFIIGIIWYFVDENMKKSAVAKFHVKQALNLIIISIVFQIALNILDIILPFIGVFSFLISLGTLILGIIGIINAINDENKEIPIIGEFAYKYLNF